MTALLLGLAALIVSGYAAWAEHRVQAARKQYERRAAALGKLHADILNIELDRLTREEETK